MLQNTAMTVLKRAGSSTLSKNCYYRTGTSLKLCTEKQCGEPYRQFHSTQATRTDTMQKYRQETLFEKIKDTINVFDTTKYLLRARGTLAYEYIVDTVNYDMFYKEFKMPDTFYSWFLITELHVWMLMLRFMADERKPAKILRNYLVEAMWNDCGIRVNKLGNIAGSVKRKQMATLSKQFNAAVIAYDEGILSDDKVLAGALWRIFFNSSCNNPEHLEKLVHYVRKHVNMLDKLSTEQVRHQIRDLKWIDLSVTS